MRTSHRPVVGASVFLLVVGACGQSRAADSNLGFEARVRAAEQIEATYGSRRTWPATNAGERPALGEVFGRSVAMDRVGDYLRKSRALEVVFHRPITGVDLQAELNRIAKESRRPSQLLEIFAALGNDPSRIVECFVRPLLADRLLREAAKAEGDFESWWAARREDIAAEVDPPQYGYTLPAVATGGACTDGAWTPTSTAAGVPAARRSHATVWTGAEMIVWGGLTQPIGGTYLNTGARYDPVTDSWTPTTVVGAPQARLVHTAVWTGREMVVWGGQNSSGVRTNTGGRYDPIADTWRPTSTGAGVPSGRSAHVALWTGSRMIVWGGYDGSYRNNGGLYDPLADTWVPTSTSGAPSSGQSNAGVWTGSEMIVWNGFATLAGRYNPSTDSWLPVSTVGAPVARREHTMVWTGTEAIVWGGFDSSTGLQDTGGRYDPATDTWTATALSGAPSPRYLHRAIWTGTEMFVWGGWTGLVYLDTGGRYNPVTNSWSATAASGAPTGRWSHTLVRTDQEVILWGGGNDSVTFQTGARYCAQPCSPRTWYSDADGDHYGNAAVTQTACEPDPGYVPVFGDCNDADPAAHPFAPEVCNGSDDDCDSLVDEGFNQDGDAFTVCDGDCDDTRPTVYPGAAQLCDGRNNDCSDPAWPTVPASEANFDGDSYRLCSGDCDDTRSTIYPGAPQICDSRNNDCSDPSWPALPPAEFDVDGDS